MDPGGQFAWFESILLKARRRRGTVSPCSLPWIPLTRQHIGRHLVTIRTLLIAQKNDFRLSEARKN